MRTTFLILAVLFSISLQAQSIPGNPPTTSNANETNPVNNQSVVAPSKADTTSKSDTSGNLIGAPTTPPFSLWSKYLLPLVVLIFGGVIVISLMILTHATNQFGPEHSVRILSMVLIITGILFLVSTGESVSGFNNINALYAPAFGLIGTLAGYLLGKLNDKEKPDDDSSGNKPAENKAGTK